MAIGQNEMGACPMPPWRFRRDLVDACGSRFWFHARMLASMCNGRF